MKFAIAVFVWLVNFIIIAWIGLIVATIVIRH
jgi:hypothetical protein